MYGCQILSKISTKNKPYPHKPYAYERELGVYIKTLLTASNWPEVILVFKVASFEENLFAN